MANCYRHKKLELENGLCPECGVQPVTTEPVTVKQSSPLSAVTMDDGKNRTMTEWAETKPMVTFTKSGGHQPVVSNLTTPPKGSGVKKKGKK